jgi:hypothetical protein
MGQKMKSARARYFLGLGLILPLVLGLAAAIPAWSLQKTSQEEAALFSYRDLGAVDLSPKKLEVEVYVSPSSELAACRRMISLVEDQVQQFFARMGVNLVYCPAGPQPGPLAPAQRLRVELLSHREWLEASSKAFEVAPPLRLRFFQVCRDKCAFAHLPLSVTQISFKRYEEAQLRADPEDASLNRNWLANLLCHELGHLMGLHHPEEFVNHPIPLRLPDKDRTPNFMSQRIAFQKAVGFVEFQRLLVHSYLGKGKVYQQYQYVNFDPLRHLELVQLYNGYREPRPRSPIAAQRVKQGNPRAFGGDEEDEAY